MFSAKLYFESTNINYKEDDSQQRPLSLLVANLKGPAAAWYREYVSHEVNYLLSINSRSYWHDNLLHSITKRIFATSSYVYDRAPFPLWKTTYRRFAILFARVKTCRTLTRSCISERTSLLKQSKK